MKTDGQNWRWWWYVTTYLLGLGLKTCTRIFLLGASPLRAPVIVVNVVVVVVRVCLNAVAWRRLPNEPTHPSTTHTNNSPTRTPSARWLTKRGPTDKAGGLTHGLTVNAPEAQPGQGPGLTKPQAGLLRSQRPVKRKEKN